MSELGYTSAEIQGIFKVDGVPSEEKLETLLLSNKYSKRNLDYDEQLAESVPTQKELVISILKILSDGKPYTSVMMSDSVAAHLNLFFRERRRNPVISRLKNTLKIFL
ncbi:hypothetical protein M3221_18280 [Domibacillus indicus]|uniref:hypothetical protein n=1 Tax=Domibacillus indicus TaxID=1437523 RepID=UPI00203E2DBB|nr:hypothetical protein [Domibacillus indicus]MCM3790328.1 hypothetical protein [Domibacillus indicus]